MTCQLAHLTSGNEYTPWLAEGLTEAEYFQKLYLEMSNKVARYEESVGKLKKHLSHQGAYYIKRRDGEKMHLSEVLEIGAIFEELDQLLEA